MNRIQSTLYWSLSALFITASVSPATAALIFDDDFTGTGGATPPGWTVAGFSDGTASTQDLAGSIVRVSDPDGNGPLVLINNTTFDPSLGFTYTGKIDSIIGDSTFFGIANNLSGNPEPRMLFEIQDGTDIKVTATNGGNDDTIDLGSTLSLADDVIFTVNTTSYRLQNGSFDSGFRTFAADFTTSGVTLATFGSSTSGIFGVSGNGSTSTADYNQLTLLSVAVGGGPIPVPEPASLVLLGLGMVGLAGYSWRRYKQRVAGHRNATNCLSIRQPSGFGRLS